MGLIKRLYNKVIIKREKFREYQVTNILRKLQIKIGYILHICSLFNHYYITNTVCINDTLGN